MADEVDLGLKDSKKTNSDKTKGYLVIDYGEKIKADFKFSQEQIQRQVEHLQREISLLWEIIRDLMILFGPMVVGWMGYFLSRMLLSRMWEGLFVAFNSFLMSACLILFMTPLNESLVRLMAAFDEFKDLQSSMDHFEDPYVEETGHGDGGLIETTENYSSDPTVEQTVDNLGAIQEENDGEVSDDGEENTNNNDLE
ncbi:uncharacterized protein LOC127707743 [Mytilus californianus]|uniref:uncharacterized protein LOC127707743 n=1 Tax=Mytilus californianus TaxID=6549 RepID=UPI002247CFB6|nr:uncharacterized protein LOC127707743 [Mytilus californianus]